MTTPSSSFTYKYNDGGNRIYKTNVTIKEYYLYDHTGRALLIYDMNTGNLKSANIYGSGLIGRVDISGGATGGYYERLYYVKDHLGSTRVTISTVETGNNIAFAADYYPFGEAIREYQVGTKGGKYKFTEKERDSESSYDYFGARYYNNKLGVWLSVDPLNDKYKSYTPYHFVFNNPLKYVDEIGLDSVYFADQKNRPNDNGKKGTTYTADIIIVIDGKIVGYYPNGGSTYPNSVSNSDNSPAYNTVSEGTYDYNNKYGHKVGQKKGLNLVDETGERKVPGETPQGQNITMTYVNVHEGASDNGNFSSRGSKGCLTLNPVISSQFFSNFNWNGNNGNTGKSNGKVIVTRGEVDKKVFPFNSIHKKEK